MPINDTLARYSDFTFGSAVVTYVLALLLLVTEYAAVATSAPRTTSGVLRVPVATTTTPGLLAEKSRRPVPDRLGRMGISLVIVAWTLQVASIALRGLATDRAPWGNMYEFIALSCAAAVATGFVAIRSARLRPMWIFLLIVVLILMFTAGTVLYASASPVVPALQSYWLRIHVSVVAVGSGMLMLAGVASLMFLLRIGQPPASENAGWWRRAVHRLPDAETLDRAAYRITIVAFPLFGAGVVFGAIWAEAAWGRFWGWDPKETMSFVAFIIYAAYLHARATAGWRNTRAAWVNVAGFFAMLGNLFVINLVISGLHSYAGLT